MKQSAALRIYLVSERVMRDADDLAKSIRGALDRVWLELTDEDRKFLDDRNIKSEESNHGI